jgi:hypothetical protein
MRLKISGQKEKTHLDVLMSECKKTETGCELWRCHRDQGAAGVHTHRDRVYKTQFRPKNFGEIFSVSDFGQMSAPINNRLSFLVFIIDTNHGYKGTLKP